MPGEDPQDLIAIRRCILTVTAPEKSGLLRLTTGLLHLGFPRQKMATCRKNDKRISTNLGRAFGQFSPLSHIIMPFLFVLLPPWMNPVAASLFALESISILRPIYLFVFARAVPRTEIQDVLQTCSRCHCRHVHGRQRHGPYEPHSVSLFLGFLARLR